MESVFDSILSTFRLSYHQVTMTTFIHSNAESAGDITMINVARHLMAANLESLQAAATGAVSIISVMRAICISLLPPQPRCVRLCRACPTRASSCLGFAWRICYLTWCQHSKRLIDSRKALALQNRKAQKGNPPSDMAINTSRHWKLCLRPNNSQPLTPQPEGVVGFVALGLSAGE